MRGGVGRLKREKGGRSAGWEMMLGTLDVHQAEAFVFFYGHKSLFFRFL